MHSQRIVPCPVTRRDEQGSVEIREQSDHCDLQYHVVELVSKVKKRNGKYQVLVKWLGFDTGGDET